MTPGRPVLLAILFLLQFIYVNLPTHVLGFIMEL